MSRAAKRRPTPTSVDQRQLNLLTELGISAPVEVPEPPAEPAPGGCDDDQRLRRCLHEAIKESGRSREEIAVTMSQLAGRSITVAMLNTWTAPSRPNNFPAQYLRAFCLAIGEAASQPVWELLHEGTGTMAVDRRLCEYIRQGQLAVMTFWLEREQLDGMSRLSAVTGGR